LFQEVEEKVVIMLCGRTATTAALVLDKLDIIMLLFFLLRGILQERKIGSVGSHREIVQLESDLGLGWLHGVLSCRISPLPVVVIGDDVVEEVVGGVIVDVNTVGINSRCGVMSLVELSRSGRSAI
jgi:hypothetical protein